MLFPYGVVARPSFSREVIRPLEITDNRLVFSRVDDATEMFDVRVGMSLVFRYDPNAERLAGSQIVLTEETWRKIGAFRDPNLVRFLYPKSRNENSKPADWRRYAMQLKESTVVGFRGSEGYRAFHEAYLQYARSKNMKEQHRVILRDEIAEIAIAMAFNQVRGDVEKALNARGLTFSGKVVGNYLTGWDVTDANGNVTTFEQFLQTIAVRDK